MKMIIMRGIPGSGKSTYIAGGAAQDARVCSADAFFIDAAGKYNFDPSKLSQAHADCFRRCIAIVSSRYSAPPSEVYIDNTNLTAVEMAPYVALAAAFGIQCEIVTIHASPETGRRNVHGVPDHALRRMANVLAAEVLPPFWNVVRHEVNG